MNYDNLKWLKDGDVEIHLVHGGTDDDTRAMLLRVQPGTVIGKHHHHGEVHVWGISGTREILEDGRIVGPGDYVYEPAGNTDSWRVVGDEPAIVFLTARGALEYLDDAGNVKKRSTTGSVTTAFSKL
ncbi:MAG: cupin domain-containing protein [Kofleriaceae bacterium]